MIFYDEQLKINLFDQFDMKFELIRWENYHE